MLQKRIHDINDHGIDTVEGEPIELKVERIIANKEAIEDTAPIIYTPRDEGVRPEYDIRTDRFEIANQAMDKVAMMKLSIRKGPGAIPDKSNSGGEKSAGAEPTQASNE